MEFDTFSIHIAATQTTKAVYNRIIDLKIATPKIILNFALILEEKNYFEEAFKAYERGVALFKWPHLGVIWNTYLTKFVKRYVSTAAVRRPLGLVCAVVCGGGGGAASIKRLMTLGDSQMSCFLL